MDTRFINTKAKTTTNTLSVCTWNSIFIKAYCFMLPYVFGIEKSIRKCNMNIYISRCYRMHYISVLSAGNTLPTLMSPLWFCVKCQWTLNKTLFEQRIMITLRTHVNTPTGSWSCDCMNVLLNVLWIRLREHGQRAFVYRCFIHFEIISIEICARYQYLPPVNITQPVDCIKGFLFLT